MITQGINQDTFEGGPPPIEIAGFVFLVVGCALFLYTMVRGLTQMHMRGQGAAARQTAYAVNQDLMQGYNMQYRADVEQYNNNV